MDGVCKHFRCSVSQKISAAVPAVKVTSSHNPPHRFRPTIIQRRCICIMQNEIIRILVFLSNPGGISSSRYSTSMCADQWTIRL